MLKKRATLIVAVLLLCVFVFTLVQKSVHAFHHHDEPHCSEKSAQHYHDVEHGCELCDYTLPVTEHVEPTFVEEPVDTSAPVYVDITEQLIFFLVDHVFLQRGPPSEKQ